MDQWDYFNWPEILREAKMRHTQAMESSAQAITPEMLTLEYWTAWCAHANAAAALPKVRKVERQPFIIRDETH